MKRESELKSRAIRIGGTVLVTTVMGLALEQGVKTVNAETPTATATPTRTPTPTGTPTPDIEIVNKQATITALNKQLERARQLADLRATEAAVRREIDKVMGTPPATSTPTAQELERQRIEQAAIKEIADRWGTATAQAELRPATPTPFPLPPRPAGPKPKEEHDPTGGLDIGGLVPWVGGVAALVTAVVGWLNRGRILGLFRRGGGDADVDVTPDDDPLRPVPPRPPTTT